MLREKVALITLVLLVLGLLLAASSGIWLCQQPALALQDGGASLWNLSPQTVLTILMALSLMNLFLLALYIPLQWPHLGAGAAALFPNPTVRGLTTGAVALVALVLLALPWLTPRGAVPVSAPATAVPEAGPLAPVPPPTLAPPEARLAAPGPAKSTQLARSQHSVARPRLVAARPRLAYRRPPGRLVWAKKPRHTCLRLSSTSGRLSARY
ncbi:MAG: hypothetical protein ACUVRZ_13380 [Desulfobacca sp.]|uniref:hypothetical protein n=1 Tax=Desulfobacca sp. TaxID=2067990 RepID=UPI00404A1FEF